MLDILQMRYTNLKQNGRRAEAYLMKLIVNGLVLGKKARVERKVNLIDSGTAIVSVTTHPRRISLAVQAMKTLVAQKADNFHVILWLARDEFPDGCHEREIRLIQSMGVDVRFVELNLRPHNKYYHAFAAYPSNPVVVFDDDILYPSWVLDNLLSVSGRNPGVVCAQKAKEILVSDEGPQSYNSWPLAANGSCARHNIALGYGGAIYPPFCGRSEALDAEAIKYICIRNDDLWLNFVVRRNGLNTMRVERQYSPIQVVRSEGAALSSINVGESANDNCVKRFAAFYREKGEKLDFTAGLISARKL